MWELGKEILELRFNKGFHYWDRTGDISLKVCEALPSLNLENATPGQTNFIDEENGIRVRFSYNTINLAQELHGNPSIKLFDAADALVKMLIREISVKTITRVGHRIYSHRKFATEAKSYEYILDTASKRGLGGNLFAGDDWMSAKKLKSVACKFEDEKVGIRLELSGGKAEFAVTGPSAKDVKKHMPQTEYLAILDVDVYTLKPLVAEELAVDALRSSNHKMIKTKIQPLFD